MKLLLAHSLAYFLYLFICTNPLFISGQYLFHPCSIVLCFLYTKIKVLLHSLIFCFSQLVWLSYVSFLFLYEHRKGIQDRVNRVSYVSIFSISIRALCVPVGNLGGQHVLLICFMMHIQIHDYDVVVVLHKKQQNQLCFK